MDAKDNPASPQLTETAMLPRNFIGGLWHGAFLAFGMALTQPTTILSSFITDLTGSTVWVGGLSTVLTVAEAIPQLFVARWIESKPRKKVYLLAAINLRILSWGILAWMIYWIGSNQPLLLAKILVIMLIVFYAGGGFANIPFTEMIGKVIPPGKRGAFFGGRGAIAAPLSVIAALAAQRILVKVSYPNNYALLFGGAAISLAIASLGFWVMKEPALAAGGEVYPTWREYWMNLVKISSHLKTFIFAQLLTGFSLMALPFYVVYARQDLHAPNGAIGWYLFMQVLGGSISNLFWARLVDRNGSRQMLRICAVTSTITPLLAIILAPLGWTGLLVIFFLVGAFVNGRNVGFQSALLDIAPPTQRGIYAAMDGVLSLPIAFLPLAAGLFLNRFSYPALFVLVSIFVAAGAWIIHRWIAHDM